MGTTLTTPSPAPPPPVQPPNQLVSTAIGLTAAQLIAYATAALPPPGQQLQAPSTDPGTFAGSTNYLELLNEQAYCKYGVDTPNATALANFSTAATNWEKFQKPIGNTTPPAWPSFLLFDTNAYQLWWAQYTSPANQGQDAPPLFFIKPAASLPPVLIVPSGTAAPPPPPAFDGPIGAAVPNNPGIFSSSSLDNPQQYPDGYIYAGPTGIYQKHIYSNPFTLGNSRVIWVKLG